MRLVNTEKNPVLTLADLRVYHLMEGIVYCVVCTWYGWLYILLGFYSSDPT